MSSWNRNLLVVSNRLPFVLNYNESGQLERKFSVGGLVTVVTPLVIANDGLWVGWPGPLYESHIAIPESLPTDNSPGKDLLSKNIIPVTLTPTMYQRFYNGCCNETFWPLFHSMPDKARFAVGYWNSYIEANRIFAEKTCEGLQLVMERKSGTLIWINDFHLLLAPQFIRKKAIEKNMKFKLALFLHIPFPTWDIFRLFPWTDDILQGMLSCDLIGFHTYGYSINFIDCCKQRLGCSVDRNKMLVEHGGRSVKICPLPIGIPFDRFVEFARKAKPRLSNVRVILGVDRLDYTKGIPQRLRAIETLLLNYPEYIGKIEMLQIAVPSRTDVKEYQDLKKEMDQIVGRINGKFTTPNWFPIRYIYDTLCQEALAGLYRNADVGFVTPLRDGMNLVAKEFVACQINTPPGVLVISPLAGAAEFMHEAIICNPYELDEASKALHRALSMPEDERTLRMNYLRCREKNNDVYNWLNNFINEINKLESSLETEKNLHAIKPANLEEFDIYFSKGDMMTKNLALLLDYDGTLAPMAPHPDMAILPQHTKDLLQKLANHPRIHISIISGRSVSNVQKMVGIDNITYAGSHGFEIIHPDGRTFTYPVPLEFEEKAKDLFKNLQEQVCKDGAWVENKGFCLTLHYRQTSINNRPKLISKAKQLIESAGFIPSEAHTALEAKPPFNWNKGRAAIYILKKAFGLHWSNCVNIIYAGDDLTDEDAIQALKGMAFTFRITHDLKVNTSADVKLSSVNCIYTMLLWVEKQFILSQNPSTLQYPASHA